MKYPPALQMAIDRLSRLPTVGPKTAERFAFYLLRRPANEIQDLATALLDLHQNLTHCQRCCAIAAANPCSLCTDATRNTALLCVVAETKDMIALENSGQYQGRYHILNGTISAIQADNLDHLTIKQLLQQLRRPEIKELILAFNPDVEGETTALYLAKLLSTSNISITRLARGLPAGASLDYADPMTLSHALHNRSRIK